jgi:signal transduction histidine kinase
MRRLLRGTGHDSTWWPVLLLLLIVLVPSAGVVWMMRAAMENERLAVRQRLADAYHTQLEIAQRRVDAAWQQKLERLDAIANKYPPSRAFAECVREGIADSVVIINGSGQVLYPAATAAIVARDEPTDAAWSRAQQLEFVEHKPAEAAEAYQAIAAEATEPAVIARARQAQARSLFRAGDQRGAMAALRDLSEQDSATDAQGRSLAADAELRLLELLDRNSQEWLALVSSLSERLRDYDIPLPSDQRRFLMHALKSLRSDAVLDTLGSEDLAADFAAHPPDSARPAVLLPTPLANVWQLRPVSGRIIALFKTSTLERTIKGSLAEQPFPAGVAVAVRGPAQAEVAGNELAAVPLAPTMPGWRLSLALADAASFDTAANERVVFFLWTAVVVVAITAALALLVANMLRRQSRLTRLKNDLVATVSHELKTPLASIRLLVDTLLASDGTAGSPVGDSRQARQYLELIAQENARLSRLIDNFLTFSRMERGKNQFDFQLIDAAQIVDQAVAAVADRFDGTAAKLEVDVERPLPLVGDIDALVRVVVNLLDNAWKYTVEPKRIAVTARRQPAAAGAGDQIVIAVADNGIGLSPRALRKVFDRFYQVDQRLSRAHGGCGLGLSIVKYFVEAHGGQVTAESRLREGSVFTVSLPAAKMLDDEGSLLHSPNGIEHSPAGIRQQGAAP